MVSDKLNTLGITLVATLTFKDYVNHTAKACNFYIWGLRHIRRYISRDVANIMGVCIAGTCLDYCNALRSRSIRCRQSRNKLARVIYNVRSTPSLSFVIFIGFPSEAALRSGRHLVLQILTAQLTKLSAPCTPHWSHMCHAMD